MAYAIKREATKKHEEVDMVRVFPTNQCCMFDGMCRLAQKKGIFNILALFAMAKQARKSPTYTIFINTLDNVSKRKKLIIKDSRCSK